MVGVGTILDIGNIIFFIASFPQMINAFHNRKNLRGLSAGLLFGYMIATIFFFIAGLMVGGYFVMVLSAINEVFFGVQLYWKYKYKNE